MSEKKQAAQTADNPNKDGAYQADKFQYAEGDIEWIKPPAGVRDATPETATPKRLSREQAKDLGRRIRAKLSGKG